MSSNLPPGVTDAMIEDHFGPHPCEVCGLTDDDCICPECPVCEFIGDPDCYEKHGLVRTDEQIRSKAACDKAEQEAIEAESAMWDSINGKGDSQ